MSNPKTVLPRESIIDMINGIVDGEKSEAIAGLLNMIKWRLEYDGRLIDSFRERAEEIEALARQRGVE